MAAPALPSSVASPQPTTPASVSILTNTCGRSRGSALLVTPKVLTSVTFSRGADGIARAISFAKQSPHPNPEEAGGAWPKAGAATPPRSEALSRSRRFMASCPPLAGDRVGVERALVDGEAEAGPARQRKEAVVGLFIPAAECGAELAVGRIRGEGPLLDEGVRQRRADVHSSGGADRTAAVERRDRDVVGLGDRGRLANSGEPMGRERGAQDVDGVFAQQVLEAGDVGEAAPVAGGHGRALRERGLGGGAHLAAGLVHPEQVEPCQAVGDRERLARRRAAGAVEHEVALLPRGAAQAVQDGPN